MEISLYKVNKLRNKIRRKKKNLTRSRATAKKTGPGV